MELPMPTTEDVARYLRARTRDPYGKEIGDFTDATTPNGTVVRGLIKDAADEIAEAIGSNINSDLVAPTKRLITLLAAANVEMTAFPEQSAQPNSMYDKLMVRANVLRLSLTTNAAEEIMEDIVNPQYDFPPSHGWSAVSW